MAGGGRHVRKRPRRASLGFCPLQRMELWKSTLPGFPGPGMFPSQRFSRSQGFTPSKTLVGMFQPTGAPGVPTADLLRPDSSLAGKPLVELRPPKPFVARRPGPGSGSSCRRDPKVRSAPGAAQWNATPKGLVPVHDCEAARAAPSSRRARLWAVRPTPEHDLRTAETSSSPRGGAG
jgi:hypothetical protein